MIGHAVAVGVSKGRKVRGVNDVDRTVYHFEPCHASELVGEDADLAIMDGQDRTCLCSLSVGHYRRDPAKKNGPVTTRGNGGGNQKLAGTHLELDGPAGSGLGKWRVVCFGRTRRGHEQELAKAKTRQGRACSSSLLGLGAMMDWSSGGASITMLSDHQGGGFYRLVRFHSIVRQPVGAWRPGHSHSGCLLI